MGHILSLRDWVQVLVRRHALARQPIVFDFTRGKAYRASEQRHSRIADLAEVLREAAVRVKKPRVVRTVEGIPPSVLTQPKK